jgi:signal transduction histidine kinase
VSTARRADDEQRLDERFLRLTQWLPYLLLGASTVMAMVQPGQTWHDRLVVLGLAVVTLPWLRFGYPSEDVVKQRSISVTLVYFVGLLALEAALTLRSIYFIAFMITGFVQAFMVLPAAVAFVVVLVSSVMIYTVPGGLPAPNFTAVSTYVFLILLQTLATGGFGFLSAKLGEARENRRRLISELQEAMTENSGLHAQLLIQAREAGVHDERQRMAGEIHDTLAQGLTGIVTQLEAAQHAIDSTDQLQAHLTRARALARDSLAEARRSVQALRPIPLEESRLPDAIGQAARDWSTTSGVPVTVTVTGDPVPLLADLEITLFRVATEALANVAKYARAGRVGLTLSYMDDVVALDVRDDGVGFPAAEVLATGYTGDGHGYGLPAMRRRLQRMAGALVIESAPGEGTTVNATVPAIELTEQP